MNRITRFACIALFALAALPAWAQTAPSVETIRQRWDEIKYAMPAAQQEKAFEQLANDATLRVDAYPADAAARVWRGIVLASEAGARGGLGALSLCKKARTDFDEAIRLDPDGMQGSAYTSLGSLYYQVPGWPLGFGNDEKAEKHLLEGLKRNPDGIDSNYFYGDFLREQERYDEARRVLTKALAAAPRPGRERADAGRRAEIEKALAQVDAES